MIHPYYAFLLEENFKYCEIHDNKAVWDLPRSCQYPIQMKEEKSTNYHILNRKTNEINGKGWKCSKKTKALQQ